MNKLHLYTGGGKGKTTAAMGLCLRSLGHGGRVLVGQFVKDGTSGELAALRRIPAVQVMPCPPMEGFVFQMSPQQRAAAAQEQTAYAQSLISMAEEFRPSCIVLDELAMALTLDMVPPEVGKALITACLYWGETIVTGYSAPSWLSEMADYITCMQAEKHPWQTENLPARKGVEW